MTIVKEVKEVMQNVKMAGIMAVERGWSFKEWQETIMTNIYQKSGQFGARAACGDRAEAKLKEHNGAECNFIALGLVAFHLELSDVCPLSLHPRSLGSEPSAASAKGLPLQTSPQRLDNWCAMPDASAARDVAVGGGDVKVVVDETIYNYERC